MDTDAPNGEQPKKTRKVKKQVRKGDLPITSLTSSLEENVKHAWIEKENAMYMEDKLVAETAEKKNELESFIYEMRDKIDGVYAEYASEEEKEKLKKLLMDSEVSFPSVQSVYSFRPTNTVYRNGYMRKAMTPRRPSMFRRSTTFVSSRTPSSCATRRRLRLSARPFCRRRRKPPLRSVLRLKASERQRKMPRRPRKNLRNSRPIRR